MMGLDRENLELNGKEALLNLFEYFNLAKSMRNFIFPRNLLFENWVHKKS